MNKAYKKAIGVEGFIALIVIIGGFYYLASVMGGINMINTIMKTAHDLLLNTVFFIMGIAVLSGALAAILSEFGIIAIINKVLSPLMKPLYNLPGAAVLGIITTYLSDNPAVITLAEDKGFRQYFRKFQLPALTNLGTSFGMGLVVSAFMVAQSSINGTSLVLPVILGNLGAVIGSIVSVNIMMIFTKKEYGTEQMADEPIQHNSEDGEEAHDLLNYREIRKGGVTGRALEAALEGGKSGVKMGLEIIPGVLIICTAVMMLTNGPSATGFTGAAYEGVGLLPFLGSKLLFIFKPLFGFQHAEALSVPITSLGAVGAAISLVPHLLKEKLIGGNEIAVFTAMGMCWSGYLSTHVAMMDSLKFRHLTGKAILSHTIAGVAAGTSAHFMFVLASSFM